MWKKFISALLIMILSITLGVGAYAYPLIDDTEFTGESFYTVNKEVEDEKKVEDEIRELLNPEFFKDIISQIYVTSTDSVFFEISKPAKDVSSETIFSNKYLISGFSVDPEVCVAVSMYNEDSEAYELVCFEDEKAEVQKWYTKVGVSGFFSRELILNKGLNRIKLFIFKKDLLEEKIEEAQGLFEERDTEGSEGDSDFETYISWINETVTLEEGTDYQLYLFSVNSLDRFAKDSLLNNPANMDDILNKDNILNKMLQLK